jgi:PAS domain S-box-containing protein
MTKETKSSTQQIENALRKSEEKYRTLTENIALGIFRSTPGPKGRFIEVNPAFVKMLGYSNKRELLAIDVAQIYQNPKDRSKLSKKISAEGFVKNEELNLQKKDGTQIIISETAIAVRDKKGKILYFDGIVEDITQRKKVEEELYIQKTYLEELFNSAPEAIVLHDNNDLVVNVNYEFTKMFGYTRKEAIGKPINELVAPENLKEEAASLSNMVIHSRRVEVESQRRCKNGDLIHVSILGAPIIHDGKQMGVYAIYRDITKRKNAEEELLIQKTYLEKLFNSAPEAIVLHDNKDIVININDEFTKMFGYSREEAIGQPINNLVSPEHYQDEAATLSYQVIHGERVEAETQRKCKDGTLIDVSILGAPIFLDGEQMGVYAIYRDITEHKKAQEARIRSEEEARMARNIQLNFLPKSNPIVKGYNIAGKSIPALNVGGDYFDFIRLDEHRLAICLGDVSGNGLAASLVMANLQATIRSQALFDAEPDQCLERANKQLYLSTDARIFISLFYGILDTKKHTLKYANAGQDLPVLFSNGRKPYLLKTRGMALGLRDNVSYESEEIPINRRDQLLIYTDGLTEAMNERKEQFGDKKLKHIIKSSKNVSPNELIKTIIKAVQSYSGDEILNDDLTIVLIFRK